MPRLPFLFNLFLGRIPLQSTWASNPKPHILPEWWHFPTSWSCKCEIEVQLFVENYNLSRKANTQCWWTGNSRGRWKLLRLQLQAEGTSILEKFCKGRTRLKDVIIWWMKWRRLKLLRLYLFVPFWIKSTGSFAIVCSHDNHNPEQGCSLRPQFKIHF